MEPSPILQTTIPGFRLILLKRAAPTEISAAPPTIALLGILPKGAKKTCIEPPKPLLKPLARPNISVRTPYSTKS